MRFFGLDAKVIVRKNSFVVYMKEGNNITDTLNLMGSGCITDEPVQCHDS